MPARTMRKSQLRRFWSGMHRSAGKSMRAPSQERRVQAQWGSHRRGNWTNGCLKKEKESRHCRWGAHRSCWKHRMEEECSCSWLAGMMNFLLHLMCGCAVLSRGRDNIKDTLQHQLTMVEKNKSQNFEYPLTPKMVKVSKEEK